jgi:hypothetical protein
MDCNSPEVSAQPIIGYSYLDQLSVHVYRTWQEQKLHTADHQHGMPWILCDSVIEQFWTVEVATAPDSGGGPIQSTRDKLDKAAGVMSCTCHDVCSTPWQTSSARSHV